MGRLQTGHLDPGEMMDSDAGSRDMHTFKKLPIQAPQIKAAVSITGVDISDFRPFLAKRLPVGCPLGIRAGSLRACPLMRSGLS